MMTGSGSVWDDIPEEDRGFLAGWYQTIDEVGYGTNEAVAHPEEQAAQVLADADARQTYADKIRSYLLTTEALDSIPEPQPLIEKVLFLDSLAWIIGRPGCGKSFVALDWAGHIGSGLPWCGFPTAQGTVLYISPESPGGVRLRVRAWEAAMGQPMSNVYFLPMAVQAAVGGHWQALMEVAAELRPSLIILDTQARMTVGMEENSAADMGQWVDQVERLRAATKACVLIVHHTTRGSNHARGSTALEGAASTIVTVVNEDGLITVGADPDEGGKTKDVAPFDKVVLRMVPSGESIVLAESATGMPANEVSGAVMSAMSQWWHDHGTDPISVSLITEMEYFSRRNFFRIKKVLVDRGFMEEVGQGRAKRYSLLHSPDR